MRDHTRHRLLPALALVLGCQAMPASTRPDAAAERPALPDRTERLLRQPPTLLDVAPPEMTPGQIPRRLSQTGLYASIAERKLAPGVLKFKPQYELWSDGADKERWMLLPPGTKIDTSNMDRWTFPVGTKLWKEFRRDGKLLETRLMWKRQDMDGEVRWYMAPYAWDAGEREALHVVDGVENARGTGHQIPPQRVCLDCHKIELERPIGMSAILMSGAATGANLRYLVEHDLITHRPATANPDGYVVPGDETTRKALGYMQANCGGCHAPDTVVWQEGIDMSLRLHVGELSDPMKVGAVLTTVNKLTTSLKGDTKGTMVRIKRGVPEESALHFRMGIRSRHSESLQMPPSGTDLVDAAGRALVDAWILSLKP